MAIYTIEADGKQFDIEGPDNATQDELQGAVNSHLGGPAAAPKESDEITGLRKQISELEATHVDPVVIGAQKRKLDYLEKGQTPPFALRPLQQSLDMAGEKVAEKLGEKGHPYLGATAGTAISMSPDIAMAAIPAGEAGVAVDAAKATKAGRMLLAPGLEEAGAAIGRAEAKHGIQVLEEASNAPRTRKTIIDFTNRLSKIVREGKEAGLDPKTLNMLKTETGNTLDFLKVAKEGASPKQLVSKGTIARLAKVKEALTRELGSQVPEVGEALKDYGASRGRQQAVRALGRGLKTAAKVAGIGVPGAAAIKYLFK